MVEKEEIKEVPVEKVVEKTDMKSTGENSHNASVPWQCPTRTLCAGPPWGAEAAPASSAQAALFVSRICRHKGVRETCWQVRWVPSCISAARRRDRRRLT